MYDINGILFELRHYSKVDESNGKYIIPILVDFDYTITKTSCWKDETFVINHDCFPVLRKWQDKYGVKIILDTMRGEDNISPAVELLEENGIFVYGIGENPLQAKGEGCTKKIWGVFSIDDRNFGSPLIEEEGCRGYIDWKRVDEGLTPIIKRISDSLNNK